MPMKNPPHPGRLVRSTLQSCTLNVTDAAAKTSDKGAAIGGEIVIDGITIYQLTEAGLALQATIKGTKFWKNDKLN